MNLGYGIGDRVIQIDDRVEGEVIKLYYPTACKQQTMILCDDGRKYHAPSETFVKVGELEEEIVSKAKSRPPQLAMCAAIPLTQDTSQPLIIPDTCRNVNIAETTENMKVSERELMKAIEWATLYVERTEKPIQWIKGGKFNPINEN